MSELVSQVERDRAVAQIDAWAAEALAENPVVAAVEQVAADDGLRWFVRVNGEEKDVFTLWLVLRQRMLHVECYLMPAPEENQGALFEHLLRRNLKLHQLAFAIGAEDGIYLRGEHPLGAVDPELLDEVLGSVYAAVELCFRPAMRIGFASRFPA